MHKDGKVHKLADSHVWLREVTIRLGRPLRVLHLGNIANNAYINAKIMRRCGIEADVACMDYYHVMGCPEWEDASFSISEINQNLPEWREIDLGGYERPEWFIQGPRFQVFQYLLAKNSPYWRSKLFAKYLSASLYIKIFGLFKALKRAKRFHGRASFFLFYVAAECLAQIYKRHDYARRLGAKVRPAAAKVRSAAGKVRPAAAKVRRLIVPQRIWAVVKPRLGSRFVKEEKPDLVLQRIQERALRYHIPKSHVSVVELKLFEQICRKYDFVIGYATEGIYPLLAGTRNFACYEHGTIRDIPFEKNDLGQAVASTYSNSPAVFITNTDCVVAANRLGIPRNNQYWIPHAFDTEKVDDFLNQNQAQINRRGSSVEFFAPARHHWASGFDTWRKGNDQIIRAVAMLKRRSLKFKVIFVEWGAEVDLSKALISELEVEEYFEWIQPLNKETLWAQYLRSLAVIDQFVMPAIGSVTFEAMSLGCPVITSIDEEVLKQFFGAAPPVLNANGCERIASHMAALLSSSEFQRNYGAAGRQWIKDYHSSQRILDIQLGAIETVLTGQVH